MLIFSLFLSRKDVEKQVEQLRRDFTQQIQALQQAIILAVLAESQTSRQSIVSAVLSELQTLQQGVISAMRTEMQTQQQGITSALLSEVQTGQQNIFHEVQSIGDNQLRQEDLKVLSASIGNISKQVSDILNVVWQLLPPDIEKVDMNTWHVVIMQAMLSIIKNIVELNKTKQSAEQLFGETERLRANTLAKVYEAMSDFLPREQTTDAMEAVHPSEDDPPVGVPA